LDPLSGLLGGERDGQRRHVHVTVALDVEQLRVLVGHRAAQRAAVGDDRDVAADAAHSPPRTDATPACEKRTIGSGWAAGAGKMSPSSARKAAISDSRLVRRTVWEAWYPRPNVEYVIASLANNSIE